MTTAPMAVPPGRAGRLWLDRRLGAARRAADLLDRKLRILQAELRGLRDAAASTERQWRQRSLEADRRLLIAAMLGGERSIALTAGPGYADVRIDYTVSIGVSRPAAGSYAPPRGPDRWAGQPGAQARDAHREALAAAVRHAAAASAARVIQVEMIATRYRLHAIRDRLIPRLELARARVTLMIDELERADDARLRLAGRAGRARGRAAGDDRVQG